MLLLEKQISIKMPNYSNFTNSENFTRKSETVGWATQVA